VRRLTTTLVLAATAAALAACGDEPVAVTPQGSTRAELLRTCPAKAPSWEDELPPPSTDGHGEVPQSPAVDRASDVAHAYLDALPADQTGDLRVNHPDQKVVVQVTRDAERVRRELQERVGDDVRVVVETVRWPKAELERARARMRTLPGLTWSGLGVSNDNRVEVVVPPEMGVREAEALLAKTFDPCMFTVTEGTVRTDAGDGAP
jgi:hypothetical protein